MTNSSTELNEKKPGLGCFGGDRAQARPASEAARKAAPADLVEDGCSGASEAAPNQATRAEIKPGKAKARGCGCGG